MLQLQVDRLSHLLPEAADDVQSVLGSLRADITDVEDRLRVTSHRLHPLAVEDLGLPSALGALVHEHCQRGGEASLSVQGTIGSISVTASAAIYRIAQQALDNISKHAPDSLQNSCWRAVTMKYGSS